MDAYADMVTIEFSMGHVFPADTFETDILVP